MPVKVYKSFVDCTQQKFKVEILLSTVVKILSLKYHIYFQGRTDGRQVYQDGK
jgi:hypothetical protein